jgi:hypothetical protein
VPRRESRQLAKHLIAILLVKARRLEAERIQKGMRGALLSGLIFQFLQQLFTVAAAAQVLSSR